MSADRRCTLWTIVAIAGILVGILAALPAVAAPSAIADTSTPREILDFALPPVPHPLPMPAQASVGADFPPRPNVLIPGNLDPLFDGDAESLVARAVGHAEGTRTAEGDRTPAYEGHLDPGNGVWNLGSFSFQHCGEPAYPCDTTEDADRHQLRRLAAQAAELRQRAIAAGVMLTPEAELNGIDLANQAPLAALGQPGYVDWLKVATEKGLTGTEAIVWARVSSFWDPTIAGWNAPGLGNTEAGIEHDQRRRVAAIARVMVNDEAKRWLHREAIAHRIITQY